MMKIKYIFPVLMAMLLILTGCAYSAEPGKTESGTKTGTETETYTQIDQEEAREMMARDDGHVIVDVRRQDEYDAGHIPGAILIPNESIDSDPSEALPDYEQIILIYCRSGNRSKQAAQKLAAMGYKNIYEFGGINSWTGEIVTEEETPMQMKIGETEVPVTWEENDSVEALKQLLPLTIQMSMYGGFEQVGPLGQSIAMTGGRFFCHMSCDKRTVPLSSWAYTKLGHVNLTQEEMTDLLGGGDVKITITKE